MKYKCSHCDKQYSTKSIYQNHVLVCLLIKKTKQEKEQEDEFISYKDLVRIVGLLTTKNYKLEKRVEELEKNKKRKINIFDWLKDHAKPDCTFLQYIQEIGANVTEEHVKYLFEHDLFQLLSFLFLEKYTKDQDQDQDNKINNTPLFSFSCKQNQIYIYDEEEKWIEMTNEKMSKALYSLHRSMMIQIFEWQVKNKELIATNDKWAILFNKIILKMNSFSLRDDSILLKVKSNWFQHIKKDIKQIVEIQIDI